MYYTVCYFTGIFYAVVRQIYMLFIDNKDFVFCILYVDSRVAVSLGCNSKFCVTLCVSSKDRQLAQAVLEKRLNLENVRRREMDVEEEVSAGGPTSRSRPPAQQTTVSGTGLNSHSVADANAANIVRTLFQRSTKLTSSGDLSGPGLVEFARELLWSYDVVCGCVWDLAETW